MPILQEQISAPAGQTSARAPRHPNPRLSVVSRFLEIWLNSYKITIVNLEKPTYKCPGLAGNAFEKKGALEKLGVCAKA
jgi:hypothetical protein